LVVIITGCLVSSIENAARQLVGALGGLVRVGIGAHGNRLGAVVLCRKFGPQRLDGIGLHIDIALEIHPG
jgi:hypothetical protein